MRDKMSGLMRGARLSNCASWSQYGTRMSFELDPFLLFTHPEPDSCVSDMNPDSPHESRQITCRTNPGHMRGGKRLSNLDLIIPCDPVPDVIFTWMSECVVRDRVLEVFRDEHITGFSTRPAEGRSAKTGSPIRLAELLVTGWGGIAPEACGIREVARCRECGHLRYSGLEKPRELIDITNWDGSDFFMIWPLPRYRFVTSRVAEICRKHSITGVALERNFPIPSAWVIPGYSPGRLSDYFPSDRAHELGDPLDIF
jgi:hypothetical protein